MPSPAISTTLGRRFDSLLTARISFKNSSKLFKGSSNGASIRRCLILKRKFRGQELRMTTTPTTVPPQPGQRDRLTSPTRFFLTVALIALVFSQLPWRVDARAQQPRTGSGVSSRIHAWKICQRPSTNTTRYQSSAIGQLFRPDIAGRSERGWLSRSTTHLSFPTRRDLGHETRPEPPTMLMS